MEVAKRFYQYREQKLIFKIGNLVPRAFPLTFKGKALGARL